MSVDALRLTTDDVAAAGFDDLFTQPRADWPLPVAQVSTEDRNLPFSARLARTDRVHY